jgi:hypothetical protein
LFTIWANLWFFNQLCPLIATSFAFALVIFFHIYPPFLMYIIFIIIPCQQKYFIFLTFFSMTPCLSSQPPESCLNPALSTESNYRLSGGKRLDNQPLQWATTIPS